MIYGDHSPKPWRYVDPAEFRRWLASYLRPLEVDPSLDRKALFRSWIDPAHGTWPDNVVAKQWNNRRSCEQQVRDDLR